MATISASVFTIQAYEPQLRFNLETVLLWLVNLPLKQSLAIELMICLAVLPYCTRRALDNGQLDWLVTLVYAVWRWIINTRRAIRGQPPIPTISVTPPSQAEPTTSVPAFEDPSWVSPLLFKIQSWRHFKKDAWDADDGLMAPPSVNVIGFVDEETLYEEQENGEIDEYVKGSRRRCRSLRRR